MATTKSNQPRIKSLWRKNPSNGKLESAGHLVCIGDAMNNQGDDLFLNASGEFGSYYDRLVFTTKDAANTAIDDLKKSESRDKTEIIENIVKANGFTIDGDVSKLFHSPIDFNYLKNDLKGAKDMGGLSVFQIVEEEGRKPFYVLS